jgi:hypothetical protein
MSKSVSFSPMTAKAYHKKGGAEAPPICLVRSLIDVPLDVIYTILRLRLERTGCGFHLRIGTSRSSFRAPHLHTQCIKCPAGSMHSCVFSAIPCFDSSSHVFPHMS